MSNDATGTGTGSGPDADTAIEVRIKIAGPRRAVLPLELAALAIARVQSSFVEHREGEPDKPIVHAATRRVQEGNAVRLLLDEADRGRLRVCDADGIEARAAEIIEAALRDRAAPTRSVPYDEATRRLIEAHTEEVERGSGVSVYTGPPIASVVDEAATRLAALYTTPGWLAKWGEDRGYRVVVEFSGRAKSTKSDWGDGVLVDGWVGLPSDATRDASTAASQYIKRKDLIATYSRQWPTIERDLRDASTNGLSEAARTARLGFWYENKAIAWARARGKFKDSPTPPSGNAMAQMVHRLKG